MNPIIIAALVTATGAVLAAIINHIFQGRLAKKQKNTVSPELLLAIVAQEHLIALKEERERQLLAMASGSTEAGTTIKALERALADCHQEVETLTRRGNLN